MVGKTAPARFRLNLEYDGTRYSGWQKQADARTVQGTLLDAAARLFGTPVDIQGNGRTDAGVHALNYTAHLEARTDLTPEAILAGLNELLPRDIVLLRVARSSPRFHARHNCIARSYLYRIATRKTALDRKYVWWPGEQLDLAAMRQAAGLLTGMHDFASFAEKPELKKSTLVLVTLAELRLEGETIVLRLVASHFLWKMIRRLAGILVEVGQRTLSVAEFETLLTAGSNLPARCTAPPAGLFFEQAFYHQEELETFLAARHREGPVIGNRRAVITVRAP